MSEQEPALARPLAQTQMLNEGSCMYVLNCWEWRKWYLSKAERVRKSRNIIRSREGKEEDQ